MALISYYSCCENIGKTLYDIVGTNHLTDSANLGWGDGHIHNRKAFNADPNYIEPVTIDYSLDENLLSIGWWSKLTAGGHDWGGLLRFNTDFYISADVTSNTFKVGGANASSAVNQNQWYFITLVLDGSNYQWYIDGVVDNSGEFAFTGGAVSQVRFGLYGSSSIYPGLINDVYIWNSEASVLDITNAMNLSTIAGKSGWQGALNNVQFRNEILDATEIKNLYSLEESVDLSNGLQVQLDFNNNLNDSSGNENNANQTEVGSLTYVSRVGINNDTIRQIDGDLITTLELPTTSDFFVPIFTWGMWVKLDPSTTILRPTITMGIDTEGGESDSGLCIHYSPDGIEMLIHAPDREIIKIEIPISTEGWHYFLTEVDCVENEGGTITTYMDNVLYGTYSPTTWVTPIPASGGNNLFDGNTWLGYISKVQFWNRKLSTDEKTAAFRQ